MSWNDLTSVGEARKAAKEVSLDHALKSNVEFLQKLKANVMKNLFGDENGSPILLDPFAREAKQVFEKLISEAGRESRDIVLKFDDMKISRPTMVEKIGYAIVGILEDWELVSRPRVF